MAMKPLIRHNNGWVIIVTFIIALMLTAMPMPEPVQAWRPAWALLVLIYWCLALPHRVGIGSGWLYGLCVDVLLGSMLGQHAMGFAVVAFFATTVHQRIRVFPLWQQSLIVGAMLAVEMLLTYTVRQIAGISDLGVVYWAPLLVSVLLWPWIFIILRDIRRKARVY